MKNCFRITFYLKQNSPLSDGTCPIMCRISIAGEKCVLATHLSLKKKLKWVVSKQQVAGRSDEACRINKLLDKVRYGLYEAYIDVLKGSENPSPQAVRSRYLGETREQMGLVAFFRHHNNEFKRMVGISRSENTLHKYQYVCNHLAAFIEKQKATPDIPIYNIGYDFICDFHRYLLEEVGCSTNTVWIYMTALKRILHIAIGQGLLSTNPFSGYHLPFRQQHRNFLMREELQRLTKLHPDTPIQRIVLDAFLFGCFTGLSYSDIKRFTMDNVIFSNGKMSITIHRTKTLTPVEMPLLSLPSSIVRNYGCSSSVPLFKLPSNYYCNRVLRQLLPMVGITRRITFHSARHTFATTIALSNGIPLEVVSAMLGHRSIKTTQIYARVQQSTIHQVLQRVSGEINTYYCEGLQPPQRREIRI